MATIGKVLSLLGNQLFEPRDETVEKWALSDNFQKQLFIVCGYWIFVRKIGPQWMKNRPPLEPKRIIMAYNLLQVILCSALVIWPFTNRTIMKSVFSFGCSNSLRKDSPQYLALRRYCWCYYLLKILDLLDTVFMVIRKKHKQVTFLHVYHHVSITLMTWLYVRHTFSVLAAALAFLNCIVHVFMYFYYFLAGLGPEMQKRLWWKKYITVIQLIQFVMAMTVCGWTVVQGCDVNKVTPISSFFYCGVFVYLFGQFYLQTYKASKKLK